MVEPRAKAMKRIRWKTAAQIHEREEQEIKEAQKVSHKQAMRIINEMAKARYGERVTSWCGRVGT